MLIEVCNVQQEIPRHSQVHQLLAGAGPAQQYSHFSQIVSHLTCNIIVPLVWERQSLSTFAGCTDLPFWDWIHETNYSRYDKPVWLTHSSSFVAVKHLSLSLRPEQARLWLAHCETGSCCLSSRSSPEVPAHCHEFCWHFRPTKECELLNSVVNIRGFFRSVA